MRASFVVVEATLQSILALKPSQVSLAEYFQDRLLRKTPSISAFLNRVKISPEGKILADSAVVEFPMQDLELALPVDRFPFAMEVKKNNGRLVAQKVLPSTRVLHKGDQGK